MNLISRTLWLALTILGLSLFSSNAKAQSWKAGVAKTVVTPSEPLWMAGYASRTSPSEGALHDLWAKALFLQDPQGHKALLITLDVCGISRDLSLNIRNRIKAQSGLGLDQIVIACSHTHTGPAVADNLTTMYKISDQERDKIDRYTSKLADLLVEIATKAQSADQVHDVKLSWATGRSDFAVNRRTNVEANVPQLRQALELQGPVDHDVPVLKVANAQGQAVAVVFGYACHCTVLSLNKFSGDYAGFAQIALEKSYSGAQAMFVAGCGGDQNPLPRRTVELAESYGEMLAKSVKASAESAMKPVQGGLRTVYEEIPLAYDKIPDRAFWVQESQSSDFYRASRGRELIKRLDKMGKLPETYPYPIQAWTFGGKDLTWVFLGGEVVVDYSLRIKRNLGSSKTWVSAYCNDVMAYIPSLRVLKEGGYEGGGAMLYYAHPSIWSEKVEVQILDGVRRLVGENR